MHHRLILGAALGVIAVLLFTTVWVAVHSGPSVLTVVSVVILAMFGSGVLGALRESPR
jgi:VIT1/CCC1 family predicted Fe2+/Mn2+ transporter